MIFWTHIIIGGENIQLRMKKERPTLCERCLQFGHPKKYCRSDRKLCTDCEWMILEGTFASTAKKTRKYVKNLKCNNNPQQNEIREMWCIHSKRNTRLHGEEILCISDKRSSKNKRKTERDRRINKSTDKLLELPKRRRDELM